MNTLSRGEKARPTPKTVKARFREAGLGVAEDYLEGVVRNIVVLQDHAATLDQFDPRGEHWRLADQHG